MRATIGKFLSYLMTACLLLFAADPLFSPAAAQSSLIPDGTVFSDDLVKKLASDLAAKSYVAPPSALPASAAQVDYDQFRQIRLHEDRTIWRDDGLNFQLQVLPAGWLFKNAVDLSLVEGGKVRNLSTDNAYFDLGPLSGKLAPGDRIGFSGFRIKFPLNRPDIFDEVVVFQGASYFRAVSRDQLYGLSARGLAVNVGAPGGEEFPFFRQFWIETPVKGATTLVIHALLDSPSISGAYRFVVTPGSPTSVDVECTFYPRKELANVGIAPLTSMFLFSAADRMRINDFRNAVHDLDGLAIHNGIGEHIWRQLNNPVRLQTSDFLDQNPVGFGLLQRQRQFDAYEDLEAHYERRPSAWVWPHEGWGPGAVRLIEIPTDEEIHDNVVTFWKPAHQLLPGQPRTFKYALSWPNDVPRIWSGARVEATRIGAAIGTLRTSGTTQFIVDFQALKGSREDELPTAHLTTTAGAASVPIVVYNREAKTWRVSFTFDGKGTDISEMRLALLDKEKVISETWLWRWTKE